MGLVGCLRINHLNQCHIPIPVKGKGKSLMPGEATACGGLVQRFGALGEEADFGAQNCQTSTKADAR